MYHTKPVVIAFAFVCLLASACNQPTAQMPPDSAQSPVSATSTSTLAPSPTSTASSTPSPTATETSLPTPTHTPTPTPTLALPVGMQTQLPLASQVITAQNASQLRQFAYFGKPVLRKFDFTQDGKRGVVMTSTGVGIYDLQSGQLLGVHPPVPCAQLGSQCYDYAPYALSSDGSRLAMKVLQSVQVWDLDAGKVLELPLERQANFFDFISLSPDGKRLSFEDLEPGATKYWETRMYHYDIATGEEVQQIPDQGRLRGLLSPDGRWLAVSGGGVAVWQVKGWSLIGQTNSDQEVLDFSSDGRLLAVQDDLSIFIYQVSPWRLIRQLATRSYRYDSWLLANQVSFSQSGELLAVLEGYLSNGDGNYLLSFSVWNITTGELLGNNQEYQYGILGFSLGNDGLISQVQIPTQVCLELGFLQESDCTQVLDDENLDVSSADGQQTILHNYFDYWQACQASPGQAAECTQLSEMSFLNTDGELYTIRQSPLGDGYEIFQSQENNLRFLGGFNSEEQDFSVHWLSSDQRLILLTKSRYKSYFDQIELWDIQRQALVRSWYGSYNLPGISPDGHFLAITTNKKFILYDLQSNETVYSIPTANNVISSPTFISHLSTFAFTAARQLVYSLISYKENDQNLYNYDLVQVDLATRQTSLLIKLQHPRQDLGAIAVSPDGSLLALGCQDGSLQIYDLTTWQELNRFMAHTGNITRLFFTPDGLYLASISIGGQNFGDGFLRMWGIWP